MSLESRVMSRWENSWLTPPDDYEAEIPCTECNSDAEFEINGHLYCERCARDMFHTEAEEGEFCDECGCELDDYYRIGNEKICDSCFEHAFRI